ncbi:MAG: hypothetical protein ACOYD9_07605 [Pyramidobacter sp.]|jgi:carboxypeptidase Taq
MKKEDCFKTAAETLRRLQYFVSLEGLLRYDQWTSLPEGGTSYRQELSAALARKKGELFSGEGVKAAACRLSAVDPDSLSDIQRGQRRIFLREYRKATRIPPETLRRFHLIRSDAVTAWRKAREQRDYKIFEPWLKKAFELKKEIALALEPDAPAFDTLVGLVDEGLTTKEIDREFHVLRQGIAGLLRKISWGKRIDDSFMQKDYGADAVMRLGKRLACGNGLDEKCVTFNGFGSHGLTNRLGPRDARISLGQNGFLSLIFTLLHEGGHAMYAVRTDEKYLRAGLWGGIAGAMQEGIARFYENVVGRSLQFWTWRYKDLQQALPEFQGVDLIDFYKGINSVSPGAKRTVADEVTYSLHVIIRYELERDYFEGRISSAGLPAAWNEKYRSLLGVSPADDLEGVLQDMHWTGDYIGYFQSYALGNIYDGMLREKLLKDCPDAFEKLAGGHISVIDGWMQSNIFYAGCAPTAPELMRRVTGSSLDARPFVNYLNEKYSSLYGV